MKFESYRKWMDRLFWTLIETVERESANSAREFGTPDLDATVPASQTVDFIAWWAGLSDFTCPALLNLKAGVDPKDPQAGYLCFEVSGYWYCTRLTREVIRGAYEATL